MITLQPHVETAASAVPVRAKLDRHVPNPPRIFPTGRREPRPQPLQLRIPASFAYAQNAPVLKNYLP